MARIVNSLKRWRDDLEIVHEISVVEYVQTKVCLFLTFALIFWGILSFVEAVLKMVVMLFV